MTDAPPIDVHPDQWRIIKEILSRHVPNCAVWAFGSRAKGKAKPYSDLDLVVRAPTQLSLDVMGTLREAFSESDLPWKVDLLDWAKTDEKFQEIIQQTSVILQTPN